MNKKEDEIYVFVGLNEEEDDDGVDDNDVIKMMLKKGNKMQKNQVFIE